MNSIDMYQAEIDYRREQMRRGQGTLRPWLRLRRATTSPGPENLGN